MMAVQEATVPQGMGVWSPHLAAFVGFEREALAQYLANPDNRGMFGALGMSFSAEGMPPQLYIQLPSFEHPYFQAPGYITVLHEAAPYRAGHDYPGLYNYPGLYAGGPYMYGYPHGYTPYAGRISYPPVPVNPPDPISGLLRRIIASRGP